MDKRIAGTIAIALLMIGGFATYAATVQSVTVDSMLTGELARMRNTRAGMQELFQKADEALAANPNDYEATWQKAALLYFWGEFYETDKETKKEYFTQCKIYGEKAVTLNPNDPSGHYWKGIGIAMWSQYNGILRSLFNAPKVAAEMSKVIELSPAYFRGTPWAVRATVYAFSPTYGTLTDAYANLEKAMQYGSDYRVVYVQAATIYIHVKDWQKAKTAIDTGLALPFDNIRPLEEKLAIQQLKDMLVEVNSHL